MSGLEDLVIAGGTETMSLTGTMAREEFEAGLQLTSMGGRNDALQRLHRQSNQGVASDAIATMEGFTREEFVYAGFVSQQRAGRAIEEGRFNRSIVPVIDEDGTVLLGDDEYPRPSTKLESLAGIKPAFDAMADMPRSADGKTYRQLINDRYPDLDIKPLHHAGNSSGVVDGAAGLFAGVQELCRGAWPDPARPHRRHRECRR